MLPGVLRHYRVRAVSVVGNGDWSTHVELTSAALAKPSLPAIPDFTNLPSAAPVNTAFPAATGGSPPYRYSLSGLPPGIAFETATAPGRTR